MALNTRKGVEMPEARNTVRLGSVQPCRRHNTVSTSKMHAEVFAKLETRVAQRALKRTIRGDMVCSPGLNSVRDASRRGIKFVPFF